MVEFGADLEWSWVMAGLHRQIDDPGARVAEWLQEAGRSGMPFDTRLWLEGAIRSTHPACMAVKAAAEQADDNGYAYLRALREGIMCLRRKLDTTEALVEEARGVGLDPERFRIDLGSHATAEAFGADLEHARAAPGPLPRATFVADDGSEHVAAAPDRMAEAAVAAGARREPAPWPEVSGALSRFARLGDVEVEAVCDLPEPRAQAELWRLALEWRARPRRVLTGRLWEAA